MNNEDAIRELEELVRSGPGVLSEPEGVELLDREIDEQPSPVTTAVLKFFEQRTVAELCLVLRGLAALLAERHERHADLSADLAVLHEAMANLIERTDGAETLSDVLDRRGSEAQVVFECGDDPDMAMAFLIDQELWSYTKVFERADGRQWSRDEVLFALTVDAPALESTKACTG